MFFRPPAVTQPSTAAALAAFQQPDVPAAIATDADDGKSTAFTPLTANTAPTSLHAPGNLTTTAPPLPAFNLQQPHEQYSALQQTSAQHQPPAFGLPHSYTKVQRTAPVEHQAAYGAAGHGDGMAEIML